MSKIKEKYGLKTGYVIALFAILVLNVLWLVSSTWVAIKIENGLPLYQIANIVMLAVVAYYVFYGYKIPHGNVLRYLLLCSSIFSAIKFVIDDVAYPPFITFVYLLIIALTAYMAGRLNKYKSNVIISVIILIFECLIVYYLLYDIKSIGEQITFVTFTACLGPVTLWIDMAGAYIARYKLHTEAGLSDK